MDIPPFIPPTPLQPPQNNLREGVLLLKGLMNNLLTLPADKSLWVELLRHMPLPSAQQQAILGQGGQKTSPQPSWQPLLGEAPIELVELKLPSGQKIWAATLRSWFATNLAPLPPKSLLEVKPTKDGQLLMVPTKPNNLPAPQQALLGELWRKSLPQAQSPKQLLQLMAPLVQPLADLPRSSRHPLQPIQQFIERQSQQVNNLISQLKIPTTETQKNQIAQLTAKFINHSGVLLEPKLRSAIAQPATQPESIDEITTYDFKAQILKTLAAINQLTPHTTPGDDEWPDNLWHLFLGNKEGAPSSRQNGHWLLLETLLPSLQKTLAGIQLQQTHSL
ncbi:MAG TPA: hypothetical protein PKZ52_12125, partial [Cellvibrionaceae bacterium]|nr:hypothetical protein [Cellvibrionaceae bacterium]